MSDSRKDRAPAHQVGGFSPSHSAESAVFTYQSEPAQGISAKAALQPAEVSGNGRSFMLASLVDHLCGSAEADGCREWAVLAS